MRPKIADIIQEIPMLDTVASELIMLINDEDTTATKLEKVMKRDAILSLKILKLANSSYYSPIKPISTVAHAIRYVGFSTLRSFVYTLALQNLGKGKNGIHKEIIKLHKKLLVNAIISMYVGKLYKQKNRIPYSPDDFYTFGLFHDIGFLCIANYDINLYLPILKAVKEENVLVTDAEIGYPHSIIGAKLMLKWNIPSQYIDFVTKHHNIRDNDKPEHIVVSKIINISEYLTYMLGFDDFADKELDIKSEIANLDIDYSDIFTEDGKINKIKDVVEDLLHSFL